MKIVPATKDMLSIIVDIVQTTIDEIYPKYYPIGAVAFFKELHSDNNIFSDIANGYVYYLSDNDRAVGTVTIKENHILRLFVLREFQHKGYGQKILDFAEKKIEKEYSDIEIDASFPAKHIYLNRGYIDIEYNKILTDNGDYLCYDVMNKVI
ncbi:MAG: GNAT family N-acetyltransferase [Lachnospiraceae bacterium]|nr:GNAT family N-acetyltransferase [Lachnospiraceae bacterium]